MDIGVHCKLFKKCKICGEVKHFLEFQHKGGRAPYWSRKTFCKSCTNRRHEVILNPSTNYSDDVSLLDKNTKNNQIVVRGKTDNGKKYEGLVDIEKAKRLVQEGAALIVNPNVIHKLFSRKEFKQYILERDNYTCYYCKRYGDTVDHLIPRAKGGLSTPKNCVCACVDCNSEKKVLDLEDFIKASGRNILSSRKSR
jgi:hypothetical protein